MSPRWHVPETLCDAQSPSPALPSTPQRTHGAGTQQRPIVRPSPPVAPCVPPWPSIPLGLLGWGKQHGPPQQDLRVREPGQPAGSTQHWGVAQGLCVPLPVPWSSGTAREDLWVWARWCPAPMGDGVSLPAPRGCPRARWRARYNICAKPWAGGGCPYLGQALRVPGVPGDDLLQPLEPVVDGGLVQRCRERGAQRLLRVGPPWPPPLPRPHGETEARTVGRRAEMRHSRGG